MNNFVLQINNKYKKLRSAGNDRKRQGVCGLVLSIDYERYPKINYMVGGKRRKLTKESKQEAIRAWCEHLCDAITVEDPWEAAMTLSTHLSRRQTHSDAAWSATVVWYFSLWSHSLIHYRCITLFVGSCWKMLPKTLMLYMRDFLRILERCMQTELL